MCIVFFMHLIPIKAAIYGLYNMSASDLEIIAMSEMWFNGHHKLKVMNAGSYLWGKPICCILQYVPLLSTPRRHVPALFILCIKSLKITLWGLEWGKILNEILWDCQYLQSKTATITVIKTESPEGSCFLKTVTAVGELTQWPFQGFKKRRRKKKNTSITNDWHAKPAPSVSSSLQALPGPVLHPTALLGTTQSLWVNESWVILRMNQPTGLNQTPSFPSC